jgi:hypothetical protein
VSVSLQMSVSEISQRRSSVKRAPFVSVLVYQLESTMKYSLISFGKALFVSVFPPALLVNILLETSDQESLPRYSTSRYRYLLTERLRISFRKLCGDISTPAGVKVTLIHVFVVPLSLNSDTHFGAFLSFQMK